MGRLPVLRHVFHGVTAMHEDNRISVIVPIYNIRPYLPACIESILNQTFQSLEILLVDDGSTDGCHEICESYKRLDSRIKVIHKVNGGLVSARKTGIKAASGKYIAFVDGDDWIEPDMYRRMYSTMTEQDVDMVLCGRYEDVGDVSKKVFHGIPEGRYGKTEMLRFVYPQMIAKENFFEYGILPVIWDKLFRRECLERFQLAVDDRIVMGEDAACVYSCLLNADSIYVMEQCLYHYRQSTTSIIKQVPDKALERNRFHILWKTVDDNLTQYTFIYDLRPQWEKFMLFLMLPRADGLYKGFDKLDYLFPFPKVKKGSRIILYGAGTYGQRLYRYLERTGFCRVAAWVDRDYIQYQSMNLQVESPEVIPERQYDAIVIAIVFGKPRNALYQELVRKYPEEKISLPDEELLFSSESRKAFGLTDTD